MRADRCAGLPLLPKRPGQGCGRARRPGTPGNERADPGREEAARARLAPALGPQWLRQAGFADTAAVWGAAMPYAGRTAPWYEPAAETALRKAEDRLRDLHPYAMARYDRLRTSGLGPAEAMREPAPLFARHPYAHDAPSQPRPAQPHLRTGLTSGSRMVPTGKLGEANAAAARFFRARLAASWVPAFLATRGFGHQEQARWQAGYAPGGWDHLTSYLRGLGYSDAVIEAAGLARRSRSGALVDLFRDRAMFPICHVDGVIAGFIGRAADHAPQTVPKYLNTPATSLYSKGDELFGLWQALARLTAGIPPVVSEGPLDAIAISATGRYVGLAICGTALTARHASALNAVVRLPETGVLVAFDADCAGEKAAVHAFHVLSGYTDKLWQVELPAGHDPAAILSTHGPHALAANFRNRQRPLADLVTDAAIARWQRWLVYPEGRVNALYAAAPVIAAMPPAHIARQVARLAHRLDLPYCQVTRALADALPQVIASRNGSVSPAHRMPPR